MELIYYLVADGHKIKTPLFTIKLPVPGEYDGSETRLPDGAFPLARLQTSAAFRKYLKDRVKTDFGGIDQSDGLIAEAIDEATELADEVATVGNLLTIHGYGLKIDSDDAHLNETGLFFETEGHGSEVKAEIIAVNEPRTLKAIVPPLENGNRYFLKIVTQSSAKGGGTLLKNIREMRSEFLLVAQ